MDIDRSEYRRMRMARVYSGSLQLTTMILALVCTLSGLLTLATK